MRKVIIAVLLSGALVVSMAGSAAALRRTDAIVSGLCFENTQGTSAIIDAFVSVMENRQDTTAVRVTWKLYRRADGATTFTLSGQQSVKHRTTNGQYEDFVRSEPPPPVSGPADWRLIVTVTYIRPAPDVASVTDRYFAASYIDGVCRPEGPPPPPGK
jgi:hypothetical protein